MKTEPGARELSRSECLALLPTVDFGRLVFTEGALPALLTVNFVLDAAGVVIRTTHDSRICRAVNASVVAFQADEINAERRTGWTVTVVGQALVVTDPVLMARLAELPLQAWVPGDRDTFVVVDIGLVNGLRLGGAEPEHEATPVFGSGAAPAA